MSKMITPKNCVLNGCIIASIVALSACGGGGGGSSSGAETGGGTVNMPSNVVSGGPLSSPSILSLDHENTISTNTGTNYFKYSGTTGERLILRVNLTTPMSDLEKGRCASNPGAYSTQIHVYNSNMVSVGGACGESLTFQVPESGLYIFNFEFPSSAPGFVNAASLQGESPIRFLETGSGIPVEPKKIDTASANQIVSNVFFNYYWISAEKGRKIIVNANLNQPMSAIQKNRCAGNSRYDTQIRVYNSKLSLVGRVCGENLTFDIPESGNYILQFDYGSQSAGSFTAAKI